MSIILQVKEGHVTVMKNTIANASKEVTSFGDFPPPPQHPIYWHNKDFEEYLQSYAEHFGLEKHFRLNMQVSYHQVSLPVCQYARADTGFLLNGMQCELRVTMEVLSTSSILKLSINV